jgi:multidrug efflux pump subunit AcrA (membrane-fusion protein)
MGLFKKVVGVGLVVGIVVGGVQLVKKRKEEIASQKPPKIYPLRLPLYTPKKGKVEVTLPAVAVVESSDQVQLSSKFSGRIVAVKGLGELVQAGEVVAQLDDSQLRGKLGTIEGSIGEVRAQLKGDQVRLESLLRTYRRSQELLKVHLSSKEELDKLEGEIAQLKGKIEAEKRRLAGLEASRQATLADLNYTKIRAPISGKISGRFLNPGDLAVPGKPILGITPSTGTYLQLPLPVQPVALLFQNRRYPLLPLGRTQNGLPLYIAKVSTPLPPGKVVQVRVVLYNGEGYLLPHQTLLPRGGHFSVLLYRNGQLKELPIEPVASGVEGVVVQNLPAGQLVEGGADLLLQLIGGRPFKPLPSPGPRTSNSYPKGGADV